MQHIRSDLVLWDLSEMCSTIANMLKGYTTFAKSHPMLSRARARKKMKHEAPPAPESQEKKFKTRVSKRKLHEKHSS